MPRFVLVLSFLVLSLAVVAVAGCSQPAVPSPPQTVGDMTVTLAAVPPPHVGDNTFSVTLASSATQAPIGNANITATPEMLSPHGLGSDTSGRAQGNGLYNVPVRLGIATRYTLHLKIERTGKPAAEVMFPVEAAQ